MADMPALCLVCLCVDLDQGLAGRMGCVVAGVGRTVLVLFVQWIKKGGGGIVGVVCS
jgi:hypothetical protein